MSALTSASAQIGRYEAHWRTARRIGTPVRAQVEVGNLLREFLANVDKVEMHDRFWQTI